MIHVVESASIQCCFGEGGEGGAVGYSYDKYHTAYTYKLIKFFTFRQKYCRIARVRTFGKRELLSDCMEVQTYMRRKMYGLCISDGALFPDIAQLREHTYIWKW